MGLQLKSAVLAENWGAASSLSSPGPGHYHVDLPSAALRTDEPLAPIEDAGVGAVPSSHLGGIGFDLMLARLAPHDKPDLGSGSGTERHRWAGDGFHRLGRSG
jgi:hypothetical protein